MARRIGSDGARTRTAIRAAATRLIARQGYEALSMRRLADEIGLRAATIYRYFPNKQAMLASLIEAHTREALEAWRGVRAAGGPGFGPGIDPVARLEAFTRFHIRHHWTRRDGLCLSHFELRSLSRENFAKVAALRGRYEREVVEILRAGAASGTLAPMDAQVTARGIIALLNGLATWYRPDGPIGPTEIEDIYWRMVARLAGVGATSATGAARLQPA